MAAESSTTRYDDDDDDGTNLIDKLASAFRITINVVISLSRHLQTQTERD